MQKLEIEKKSTMKPVIKDYNLTIDYCALMVAIVIIFHEVNAANASLQWCAEELAGILNALPRAQHANFHVNPLALKQGLLLFKRYLIKWGITAIDMYQEEKRSLEFFDRGESRRSVEVKFGMYQSMSESTDDSDILTQVSKIRDKLLLLGGYERSFHETPCSVFGSLYLPLATAKTPEKSTPEFTPKNESQFNINQFKVRKSPSKLGSRAIYNSTKKVLLSAAESFGDEHALFYLESAVKKLKKRKFAEIEESQEAKEMDDSGDDSEEELDIINLEDEQCVVDAVSAFPLKYITYTEEDKKEILQLFNVILKVARERKIENSEVIAAKTTALILKKNTYYSNLSARTVYRWNENNGKKKELTGPKINEDFEEEIWGKLMLCVFEKVLKYFSSNNSNLTQH